MSNAVRYVALDVRLCVLGKLGPPKSLYDFFRSNGKEHKSRQKHRNAKVQKRRRS
jgi:hypothetical protein